MYNLNKGLLGQLASQGRHGDTELAHVNPQEKRLLESMGGAGTINPNTGLREYYYEYEEDRAKGGFDYVPESDSWNAEDAWKQWTNPISGLWRDETYAEEQQRKEYIDNCN